MSYDDGHHYFELVEVKDAVIIHVALQHVLKKLLLLKQIVVRIRIRVRMMKMAIVRMINS